MMRLQNLAVGLLSAGLFLVAAGGMHVRGGPDGTWVQVNLIHGVGGVALLLGTVLSLLASAVGERKAVTKDNHESDK